ASFVVFASLIPGKASATRVAAQVVSRIGFLGDGIIFRESLHVTGLNTAATLWCSAAVGLLAGSGHPPARRCSHRLRHAQSDTVLEQIVARLSLKPTVSAASWSFEALVE
ncbi:MAG: MgtC/SapB family protein, partial [Bradyrhizobium sp.]|nr:MgtC/SapB family protein [Bradyrhizobium sp.]